MELKHSNNNSIGNDMEIEMPIDENIPRTLSDISDITSISSLDEIQNVDPIQPNLINEEQKIDIDFVEMVAGKEYMSNKSWLPAFMDNDQYLDQFKNKSPLQIYDKFITNEFWELVATQTNIYASKKLEYLGKTQKQVRWKPCSPFEIKKFFHILIVMSVVQLPEERMYWEKSNFFSIEVGDLLSRDRFFMVKRFLHLTVDFKPSPHLPVQNRLSKIEPAIEYFSRQWVLNKTFSKYLTIDECMVSYKGRIIFLQYNPFKHEKWGIKCFAITDSSTGYIYKIIVYSGKEHAFNKKLGLGYSMVTKLLEGLENKGHIIFFDNYYSSIKLFETLTKANFGVTGTWNKGRKSFPAAIRTKSTKKGDVITFVKNNLMITIWHDKKPVHIMSNIFGSNLIDFENRRGKQMKKPEAILEYNKCKHGVDKVDQMLAYSSFNRRCYKWWQKILFYLHDTTINNISILYYAANPEVKSNSKNLDLRLSIINEF